MILKEDVWLASNSSQTDPSSTAATPSSSIQHIRGAINFRRVKGSFLYGLSQPTEEGIRRVLDVVKGDVKPGAKIVWIGVREEPLCNIKCVGISSAPQAGLTRALDAAAHLMSCVKRPSRSETSSHTGVCM